jgi:hypothetical protein
MTFVTGKRDMEANAVSVRVHGKGHLGAKPHSEAIAHTLQSIKERRASWCPRTEAAKAFHSFAKIAAIGGRALCQSVLCS